MTDWNEHEDAIDDAISDSIDVDWTSRTGAKAVVAWLNENAPSMTRDAEHTPTPQSVVVPVDDDARPFSDSLLPEAMIDAGLYHNHRSNPESNMIASFKAMMSQGEIDGLVTYTHPAAPSADKLLDALRDQSWDLRCFNIPTGGDDFDIGWRVIGHWQAEPRERTIAEVFTDDPAEAVRQALAALEAGGA